METNKLIDRLRELSKIGIVNYKHDTPVLIEAADRIEELEEHIAIMQESMETLEKRQEWVSVKDKLPEWGKDILVYIERNAYQGNKITRKREIAIGWHIKGLWHVDGCSKVVVFYWQELPEPPKEVSE